MTVFCPWCSEEMDKKKDVESRCVHFSALKHPKSTSKKILIFQTGNYVKGIPKNSHTVRFCVCSVLMVKRTVIDRFVVVVFQCTISHSYPFTAFPWR